MTYGVGPGLYPLRLRFAPAFWFCDLVLRFGAAFWFCVLLIEDSSCVFPREDSARFKTWLHFSQDLVAFCFEDFLRFVSRLGCVLSQELPRFTVLSGQREWVNIFKSIDEGPFIMRTVHEPLAEGTEGAPHLDAPGRVRINQRRLGVTANATKLQVCEQHDLNGGRFVTAVKLNRGLRDSNYDQLYAYLKQHDTHAKENKMMLERFSQHTVDPFALMSNVSHPQHYSPSSSTSTSTYVPPYLADNAHLDSSLSLTDNLIENLTNTLALLTPSYKTFLPKTNNQLRTSSNTRNQATVQDDRVMVQNVQGRQNRGQGMNPQGGGAAGYGGVHNRDLALNVDNVFQADDCDPFDSNVDEAPTAQTMFMANLSSADPVTDEAGLSYDSDILSEVQDHDHYQDTVCAHHEEHAMHDNVQLNRVVDSHADYTSNSNMIPYDQYVKDNAVPVVHSNVSYVPNYAYMMIYNDMFEPHAQSISTTSRNTVVENSLTAELATYKEQVELPKPYYNELNKVDIGYKNPLCLTRAKQVQPSLYNGHEIIKDSHVPAIVHNTEDTIEIAEITRRKMNDKIKDPEYVTHKVKIAPHDYSKENFLATFTPQKQLTPEQIFWSQDLIKWKSEALKEQTTVSRPVKALTVYPPNTSATLVPIVLPTKSQVKIHIFTLIQLFSKFDKTCKKRITPTGLTEGERGFEQTKECYLKEARCLELEAELSNLRNKSHHDNHEELVNYFSKLEVNHLNLQLKYQNLKDSFGNNLPTFDKDTPDFDSVFVIGKMQAFLQGKDNVIRKLKNQISHLQETRSDTDRTLKVRTADSQITQLTKTVTNLQAQNDLFRAENDKIKQHYKELYDSIKITRAKYIEQVTTLTTENVNLKAQILDKVNSVSKDHVKPKVLARGKYAIDVEPIVPCLRNKREAHLDYLRHLKESVETIRDIVEEAKVVRPLDRSIVFACRYTKHSHELLEYVIGTCPQDSHQRDKQLAYVPLIRKKPVTFAKPSDTSNSYSKHMTGDRSRLMNFVKKFARTVRFGNDHFGAVMGYGDYVIGESVISRVYYVEGLGHNLFPVRQFCDSDLEVAFRKHSCYVRDMDGV
nr:integrase, catalytic region, zinc finger, CCHC-type, peptidase aspartic, catalytic [Tanacetum cinerariifolium]